jgi:hypothetical protein
MLARNRKMGTVKSIENKIRDRELITIKWLKKHFVNE